ncbi:MAG: putative Zn-dependent protease [Paracoccaceae bacterium]|jgi:predicted Zn-dependent protease
MFIDPVRRLTSIPALVLSLMLYAVSTLPAAALTLLRDPGIEHGLAQLAMPVLRAAGLNASRVRVLVVNDSSFNAFVIDSQTIFLNYGLILKAQNARMLQAVIAHEAAHISNGHIARRMGNFQNARTLAGLGAALAVIAAASGAGEAAAGIALGTSSSAQRIFLKHTRAEEASADRSAASYMRRAGVSPKGLVELHEAFHGQELLSVSRQDPYMQSHPLSRDRIRAAKDYLAANGDNAPPNPNADYWFARVRGKLSAFMRSPKWTMQRSAKESAKDIRQMRQAVAYHRLNNLTAARTAINGAIAIRPEDPYYYDLKGQIEMENRRWGAALAAYGTAQELAPRESLIMGGYGRALLASGQSKAGLEALEKARSREFRDARLLRDLAIAYAKTGQNGMAALATAERYALEGQLSDAGLHARRAIAQLPTGSAAWQRAEDVLIASERYEKGKKKR